MASLHRIVQQVRRAASLAPHHALRKAAGKAWKAYRRRQDRSRDRQACTYVLNEQVSYGPLRSYLRRFPVAAVSDPGPLVAAAEHYLAHRFDLLGSGWIEVHYGMACRGLEGHRFLSSAPVVCDPVGVWLESLLPPASLAESQRIWRLVDSDYRPLDWQLDFKSGYRWSARTWYRDIVYGKPPGVDIKVPWELARMQHLPQLAGVAALTAAGRVNAQPVDVYAREFRNQVLDFIATNPPRFGVNWATTMDVAIRAANWLVAYDLFRAGGAEFDPEFETVFARSVLEHGRHILENLEWAAELRGNHYLANVVGLLFVAAYLPRNAEIDAKLVFAVQEVIAETQYQFTADGANFEASTSYHRLCAEHLIYATALILGLDSGKLAALLEYDHHRLPITPPLRPGPMPLHQLAGEQRQTPFPAWYFERLERMVEFTIHTTKPNGRVLQIGDNDSGRFLKLFPVLHPSLVAEVRERYASLDGYAGLPDNAIYWEEDHLDHRHLVAAAAGLFDRPAFSAFSGSLAEACIVRDLAGGMGLPSTAEARPPAECVRIGFAGTIAEMEARVVTLGKGCCRRMRIALPGNHPWDEFRLLAYPDFGFYLVRSRRVYLALRCGPIGQNGAGGHAHNDQLHLELMVDGKDWIADPGTYVYTPLPDRRNAYRSTLAHFTPQLAGLEPARLDLGLFRLGDESQASCLYWGPEGFAGVVQSRGRRATCLVRLQEDGLIVVHAAEGCRLTGTLGAETDWRALLPTIPQSPGYGIRSRDGSA